MTPGGPFAADPATRGAEDGVMSENVTERLEQLEKSVKRAVETIAVLRRERDGLTAKVAGLEAERRELLALRQERKDMLAQVDGILKELDKLDL